MIARIVTALVVLGLFGAAPVSAHQTMKLERHDVTLQSGETFAFSSAKSFGAKQQLYVTVLVNDQDTQYFPLGPQLLQCMSREVFIVVKSPAGAGRERVKMVNFRTTTAVVSVQMRWEQ